MSKSMKMDIFEHTNEEIIEKLTTASLQEIRALKLSLEAYVDVNEELLLAIIDELMRRLV